MVLYMYILLNQYIPSKTIMERKDFSEYAEFVKFQKAKGEMFLVELNNKMKEDGYLLKIFSDLDYYTILKGKILNLQLEH